MGGRGISTTEDGLNLESICALQALTDKAAGKAASMLKPKSIEEACQLVELSQHLDSSIYGVKHQEHNSYTERKREPI
jgi:hypothetical protein